MDTGFSSYHNGGPTREQDFSRLAQTIATSILKISQSGMLLKYSLLFKILMLLLFYCNCISVSSMQKMVNQLGSSTDSQELRNQLYVNLPLYLIIIKMVSSTFKND